MEAKFTGYCARCGATVKKDRTGYVCDKHGSTWCVGCGCGDCKRPARKEPNVADLIKCAAIADQLQSANALARRISGDLFEYRVAPWKQIIVDLAEKFGCSPLEVPLQLERDGSLPEHPMWLFAALVEVVKEADRG